jgi:hypothetical protein
MIFSLIKLVYWRPYTNWAAIIKFLIHPGLLESFLLELHFVAKILKLIKNKKIKL